MTLSKYRVDMVKYSDLREPDTQSKLLPTSGPIITSVPIPVGTGVHLICRFN
jgi:hypothetical protein